MRSASVVIIGNEILTGKFADENGPYFITRFRALGVSLRRLVVIPDGIPEIADEVRACSAQSDEVFTTGGVGPTHDDLTFEGVAEAFGLPLRVHPDLLQKLREYGAPEDAMNLRMATVPEGAQLVWPTQASFPIVKVRNVWVLPGVPALVRQKFEAVAPQFAGEAVSCVRVFARNRESDVAGWIAQVASDHRGVEIGSYPRWGEGAHRLIVTLEASSMLAVQAARDQLVAGLDVVTVEGP